MAGKDLPIDDALRAMIWVRYVEAKSGRTCAHWAAKGLLPEPDEVVSAQKAADMRKIEAKFSDEWRERVKKGELLRWDLYATGQRTPDEKTRGIVDAFYSGTACMFEPGPAELAGLFEILAEDTRESTWRTIVDDWLFGPISEGDDLAARESPVKAKLLLACRVLMPAGLPADERVTPFVDGHSLRQLIARSGRLENEGKAPTESEIEDWHALRCIALADVIGVLALWRLVKVSNQGGYREARWLARGIVPWLDYVLAPWGIADKVAGWMNVRAELARRADLVLVGEGQKALPPKEEVAMPAPPKPTWFAPVPINPTGGGAGRKPTRSRG